VPPRSLLPPRPLFSSLILVALAVLAAATSLAHRRAEALRSAQADVDAHVVVPSPRAARFLSLGENELLADLMWARTLVYYGEGLVKHTGMPDVERLIALINALDPWWRHPYLWGAYATTFRLQVPTQEEFQSSVAILRRAIDRFPDDWEFAWMLGNRLFWDLRPADPETQARLREEGAFYIERAMHLPGAPPNLPIMAAAMRTKLGQKERALRELREMILNADDDQARRELFARYAEMRGAEDSDLLAEARSLDQAWRATFPYAPRSFYILVGPDPSRRSGIDLKDTVASGVLEWEKP
jgi:hypothetical protein